MKPPRKKGVDARLLRKKPKIFAWAVALLGRSARSLRSVALLGLFARSLNPVYAEGYGVFYRAVVTSSVAPRLGREGHGMPVATR
jgi:hypothetical protein